MNSLFILVHCWQNSLQNYAFVGTLMFDPQHDFNRVGFIYDEDYLKSDFGPIDPANLPKTIENGSFVVSSGRAKGALPSYFNQFLPGEFTTSLMLSLYSEWSTFSDFERLYFLSNLFGEHNALSLSSHNDQISTEITCIDELKRVIDEINIFKRNGVNPSFPLDMVPKISFLAGRKPKLDYFDNDECRKFVVRLNDAEYWDDAIVSNVIHQLELKSGIKSVKSHVRMLPGIDDSILFQESFVDDFLNDEISSSSIKVKYNRVSFATLLCKKIEENPEQQITYSDLANVIKKYSCMVEADLDELFRRAYFSASVNLTNNSLSNIEMMDKGFGKWRLAPSYSNIPTPFHNQRFAVSFNEAIVTKSMVNLDDKFIKMLANAIGVAEDNALSMAAKIDIVLTELPTIAKETGLKSEHAKLLLNAAGQNLQNEYHKRNERSRSGDLGM